MTRDETKKIVAVVSMTYPNFKPENLTDTVNAWHLFLEDYSYREISLALKAYVQTSGTAFPPSVSEIINYVYKVEELNELSDADAWNMVRLATCDSLYHSKEEFDGFPDDVKAVVGSHEQLRAWAELDTETLESVIASNFKKEYRALLTRKNETMRLPGEMRSLIGKTADRLMIEKENNT